MALDSNGLIIQSFQEILSKLEADEKANVLSSLNTRDDEYIGQTNNIIALAMAELEQLIQAGFDNLDPDLAEGIWLDKLAYEKGVVRQPATKSSTVYQKFTGVDGTIIPIGTILRNIVTKDEYQVTAAVNIQISSCTSVTYIVGTLLNNTDYNITINGLDYLYMSDGTATKLEILNGLKALIDAYLFKTWTATVNVPSETLTITTSDSNNINISTTTYLTSTSVSTQGSIEALIAGAKIGVANTITEIVSAISGFVSTYNTVDVITGRESETDLQLRERMYASTNVKSVAVIPAILSRVRGIVGVTNAILIENRTAAVDLEGRPPHSYEVIVIGGSDADVANELWLTKPAGITLYGNTTTNLVDSEGVEQSIKYTRPVTKNLAFRVTYTLYTEETLPEDATVAIKNTMVSETAKLPIGKDVIPQRYFGPVYSSIMGINSLLIEIQIITNPGDVPVPGNWQSTTLPIASTERASTTVADVYTVLT